MKSASFLQSKPSRADHLVDWLGRDHQSANILATAQQHLALKSLVSEALPQGLKHAFEIAKSDRGVLTLMAVNSSVAAKLRQLAPRLASHLQSAGKAIHDIQIKTSLQQGGRPYQKPEKTARPLDATDLEAFEDLRNHLEPGPLADAVAKLLAHHSAGAHTKNKSQDD